MLTRNFSFKPFELKSPLQFIAGLIAVAVLASAGLNGSFTEVKGDLDLLGAPARSPDGLSFSFIQPEQDGAEQEARQSKSPRSYQLEVAEVAQTSLLEWRRRSAPRALHRTSDEGVDVAEVPGYSIVSEEDTELYRAHNVGNVLALRQLPPQKTNPQRQAPEPRSFQSLAAKGAAMGESVMSPTQVMATSPELNELRTDTESDQNVVTSVSVVPEPGAGLLLISGLACMMYIMRRRRS